MKRDTVQLGSAYCASQVGSANGNWPVTPFGPRSKENKGFFPLFLLALHYQFQPTGGEVAGKMLLRN
jgi:hypothetical protein